MTSSGTSYQASQRTPSSSPSELSWKLVLSSRLSSRPPSELEVLLRSRCHRLKVVEKLNGAHILIPMTFPNKDGGSISKSLAIRFYSHEDLKQRYFDTNDSMDGLKEFASSFALSLVFFVLPDELHELESNHSFTRRAMDLLTTGLHNTNDSRNTCCRLFVVPDAETALEGIASFATALQPEKEALKQAFFRRQQLLHGIPMSTTTTTTTPTKQLHSDDYEQQRSFILSNHVRQTLVNWARRFELPEGEENVLMEILGNLQSIASSSVNESVPVEDRTRQMLHSFFDVISAGRCANITQEYLTSQQGHSQPQSVTQPPSFSDLNQQLPTNPQQSFSVSNNLNYEHGLPESLHFAGDNLPPIMTDGGIEFSVDPGEGFAAPYNDPNNTMTMPRLDLPQQNSGPQYFPPHRGFAEHDPHSLSHTPVHPWFLPPHSAVNGGYVAAPQQQHPQHHSQPVAPAIYGRPEVVYWREGPTAGPSQPIHNSNPHFAHLLHPAQTPHPRTQQYNNRQGPSSVGIRSPFCPQQQQQTRQANYLYQWK